MSCQGVRELLNAYVDRELDLVTARQFDRHVTECVNCRAVYEQYQRLQETVQAQIPYFQAPEGLEEKIRARLRPAERDWARTMRREWFPRWRGWTFAASGVALLMFAALLLQTVRRPPAPECWLIRWCRAISVL